MIFKALRSRKTVDDSVFDAIYPEWIQKLADRHWTPVEIARIAADYLADEPNKKILDIGSGAGKFCLVGACSTQGRFYGVEQREPLIKLSKEIAQKNNIGNVEFIHSNIDEVSFASYQAFYFYNSFFENLDRSCPIDKTVHLGSELYYAYSSYVREQLELTPAGTKLATFWSNRDEIPDSFDLEISFGNVLHFWKKRR
ncbi:methyltransferase domain-containing protein [Flavobacterium zhairuonense]|uniref:methyltransferase domain-containing protein n=1 Tax=Flavobacterium zhairuonense TaxID=2493631 RepID=UPI00104AFF78|nr:methyltransferase domain-containing protein [Flavobacterium zhairuonense]KAF2508667.1 methyltransferase domain-containing protein [Flavobacterium zhairuonense]